MPDLYSGQEAHGEMKEFLLFELDGELYAVTIADVDQVMKIPPVTRVPNAPESIVGMFHLRGKVIVVLDLLKRLHLTRTKPIVPNYLFVTHLQKNFFAVIVDRMKTVVRIPAREVSLVDPIIEARIPPRYAKGMFMYTEAAPQIAEKNIPDIMITPQSDEVAPVPSENNVRPVLWLNIEEVLDQEDLLHL